MARRRLAVLGAMNQQDRMVIRAAAVRGLTSSTRKWPRSSAIRNARLTIAGVKKKGARSVATVLRSVE
jgi:hypothetical protein